MSNYKRQPQSNYPLVSVKKKITNRGWGKYRVDLFKPVVKSPFSDRWQPRGQWDYPEDEQPVRKCKVFGCGRNLSLQEELFGDHCFQHSGKNTMLCQLPKNPA